MFLLQTTPLPSPAELLPAVDHACGGLVTFEGRVRDHHGDRIVTALHYEAFEALALTEGQRILDEAQIRFVAVRVAAAHRHGTLAPGEAAVVVVAASTHRQQAFAACRWVIDQIKDRLPLWKREHYDDGSCAWVGCADHGQADVP